MNGVKKVSKRIKYPIIEDFKEFVREHPKLIDEVKKGEKKWKDIFEDWRLLGNEDPSWNKYKTDVQGESKKEKTSFLTTLVSSVKNLDMDQVNENLYKMNNAISSIQELLQQFGQNNQVTTNNNNVKPFMFRKD